MSSIFDITAYGAIPATWGDSTSAINSAIAALNSNGGGELYVPSNTYSVNAGALTPITVGGCVRGDGMGASQIVTADTADIFTVVGSSPFLFEDITIGAYSSVGNTGCAIKFAPSAGTMMNPQLSRVSLYWCGKGASFGTVGQATITDCTFSNNLNNIYINNQVNPDFGFGNIKGCQFGGGGRTGVVGVNQINNGGITISDCFFFQEAFHYLLQLNTYGGEDGQFDTSDIIIKGCFFDAWSNAAVSLQGPISATDEGITNIVISANSFSALAFAGFAGGNALEILGGYAGWLQEGTISNNNFQFAEQSSSYSSTPAGISLKNCDHILIGTDNSFFGVGVTSCNGIYVDHSCGAGVQINSGQRFRISNGNNVVDNR